MFAQINTVLAIGSPLWPVLPNLFMGYYEGKWINNYNKAKLCIYRRFVVINLVCFKVKKKLLCLVDV